MLASFGSRAGSAGRPAVCRARPAPPLGAAANKLGLPRPLAGLTSAGGPGCRLDPCLRVAAQDGRERRRRGAREGGGGARGWGGGWRIRLPSAHGFARLGVTAARCLAWPALPGPQGRLLSGRGAAGRARPVRRRPAAGPRERARALQGRPPAVRAAGRLRGGSRHTRSPLRYGRTQPGAAGSRGAERPRAGRSGGPVTRARAGG